MKKCLSIFLVLILVIGILPMTANASEIPNFRFELTVDGGETKEVQTGDIITVVLRLKRTDSAESYTMYAMQDEIRYDSDFFELVEGSAALSNGIVTTDIGMRDSFREFYMNYLSTSGGETWESDVLIGSFQLRVVATSGVTRITNEDYLVSTKDGTGSFDCTANELTIILSTNCTVRFESNGGSEIADQTVQYGEKITEPETPTRAGYVFDGWYRDIDRTAPWDFDVDTVTGNMTLYAAWTEETVAPPVETPEEENCDWLWLVILGVILLLLIILLPRKKVTFDTMGGSEVKAKRVMKNGKLKAPVEPRKRRQIFGGWYRDKECTIPWNFSTDKVTENVTLYAKWI